MTPDEHQLLSGLFDRIRGVASQARDRDAETFIADAVRAQPYAPYVMAQTVIVQEQTLNAAASRIEQLEARVKELEANTTASSGSFLGGIGKSIFGGAEPARPVTPASAPSPWNRTSAPLAYAPPAAAASAPWQQATSVPAAGGGFLKSALGAAAGVAGGVMLANSLSNMFGGHHQQSGFGSDFNAAHNNDSVLDHRDAGARSAMSDQQSIDDGLPSADSASYDNSDSDAGYSDDTTDV